MLSGVSTEVTEVYVTIRRITSELHIECLIIPNIHLETETKLLDYMIPHCLNYLGTELGGGRYVAEGCINFVLF